MKKQWQKSSPELVSRFDACLPKAPGVERKQMFGYPCAHVNGNMFVGLHEQRLALRLSEQDRAALLKQAGAAPFEVMGRTMREYVVIENALQRTPRDVSAWMQRALAYAQTLAPKKRRGAAPKREAAATSRREVVAPRRKVVAPRREAAASNREAAAPKPKPKRVSKG